MNELTALLTQVADEAKVYGSTEQAIHLVRRRRRLTRIVPLIAAPAVLLALVAVSVPLLRGDSGEHVSSPVSWLPTRLTPARNPAPLPTDRGVGPASLIFTTLSFSHVLVTPNGTQYQLPSTSGQQYSLSPDGRWLLALDSDRTWLRDLTGTTVRTFDRGEFLDSRAAWAPDSSRLAYTPIVCAVDPTTTCRYGSDTIVVDLDSDRQHTVDLSAYPGTSVCGVRTLGDLVLCNVHSNAPPQVWVVDGRTGAERSHVTADLTNDLTDAERRAIQIDGPFNGWQGMRADGSAVILQTSEHLAAHDVTVPADLIMVDIATGHVTGRVDLPQQSITEPTPEPSTGTLNYTVTDERHLTADLPEGFLLRHFVAGDDGDSRVRELELVDPATGRRGLTTRIDGDVFALTVRGTGW